jgi:hypothetical protein
MQYRVIIPDEQFAILEWQEDGLPAICVVNQSIANFEPKVVFGWHLSIGLDCEELADNGMPTQQERQVLDRIGEQLDGNLKANGNALFLARIPWNGRRQLVYRVHKPEVANQYLVAMIDGRSQVREFAFQMEHDQTWKYATYYLSRWET